MATLPGDLIPEGTDPERGAWLTEKAEAAIYWATADLASFMMGGGRRFHPGSPEYDAMVVTPMDGLDDDGVTRVDDDGRVVETAEAQLDAQGGRDRMSGAERRHHAAVGATFYGDGMRWEKGNGWRVYRAGDIGGSDRQSKQPSGIEAMVAALAADVAAQGRMREMIGWRQADVKDALTRGGNGATQARRAVDAQALAEHLATLARRFGPGFVPVLEVLYPPFKRRTFYGRILQGQRALADRRRSSAAGQGTV